MNAQDTERVHEIIRRNAIADFAAAMIRACGFQSVQSVGIEGFSRVSVNFDDCGDVAEFFQNVVEPNPAVFMHVEIGDDFVSFVTGDFERMATAFRFQPSRI